MKNAWGIIFCIILTGCAECAPMVTPVAKNDLRTRPERERDRLRHPDGRPVGAGLDNLNRDPSKPGGFNQGLGGAKIDFPIPITKDK